MKTIARILFACLALTASAAHAQSEWNTAQYDLYPGDFNGDGKTDVLYVAMNSNKESGIALSNGTQPIGGYQVWTASAFGIPWHSRIYRPVIGDFNWDGRADIFMHRQTPGDHYLLLAGSDGKFTGIAQTVANVSAGLTWSGDQHRIISVVAYNSGNPVGQQRGHRLFLQAVGKGGNNALIVTSYASLIGGVSGSTWTDGYQTFQWNLQQAIVHSGDFNGDGNGDLLIQAKPDILLIDYDVAIPVPKYRPNSFGIVFSPIGSAGYQFWDRMAGGADWSASRSNLIITDVDGNGRDDVLIQSKAAAGSVRLALGNATTNQLTTTSTASVSFSGSGSVGGDVYRILAGNFDGGASGGVYLQATSAGSTDLIAAAVPSGGGTATTTSQGQQSQAPVSTAVGSLPGVADVSPHGAATYSIPLWVPTGTNDLQPELALGYSSQNGGGHFGAGWGLKGVSAISRCLSTKAQNNAAVDVRNIASDRFCLDGNQLKHVSGTYAGHDSEYRTEIETFTRIKAKVPGGTTGTPTYFVAERKDGLTYEYGNTGDSQILSVGQTVARVWAVNKITDKAGNTITFSYTEDTTNGGFRINEILYTANANAGLTARYKVKFIYETLPVGERYLTYMANSIINQVSRADRIEVQYDNAVIRYYELSYETANTNRSRLTSIQACVTALQCLPATTFTYQNGTAGLSAKVDSPNIMPLNNYVLPMDVNGDGRKDLVYPSSGTDGAGTWKLALANSAGNYDAASDASGSPVTNTDYFRAIPFDYNADGFEDLLLPKASSSNWWVMLGSLSGLGAPQDTLTLRTTTGRARGIDVDGDGWQDLVYTEIAPNWEAGDAVLYRLRVPGGTFAAPTTVVVFAADTNINDAFGDIYSSAPDFNGDGRGDIMYRYTTRTWHEGSQTYSFVTRLVAFSPGGTPFSTVMSNSAAPHFGDMNGDGRTDVFYVVGFASAAYRMRLSTGTSFTAEIPAFSANQYGLDFVLDWDGDGMDDVLARDVNDNNTIYAFRSLGDGFATGVSTGIALTNDMGGLTPVDVNGDGLRDFAYWDTANSSKWSVRLHNGVMPDLLASVTDGFGGTTSFSYAPLTTANYTKGTTATAPEQDYRGSLYVVATVMAPTGITTPSATFTKTYEYRGARMNPLGRGFLGFAEILSQDSRNNLWEHSTYDQVFPYIGALKQQKVYLPNKTTVIGQIDQHWSKHDYGSAPENRSLPFIDQTTTGQRGLDGVQLTTVVQNVSVDAATGTAYDTTTTTTELGTANGVQSNAVYTQRVYHPLASLVSDTANWCLGMPGKTQLINSHSLTGGTSITRTTDRLWNTTKCRPTRETLEQGDPQWEVITDLTYDDDAGEADPNVGHVTKVTVTGKNMTPRVTKMSWAATNGRFLGKITDALSKETSITWDEAKGLPASSTDPNLIAVNWSYDSFGRRIGESRPDGTATTWSFNRCTGTSCIGDSSLRWYVHSTELASGGSIINSADKYFDVLGRVRFEDSPTLSGTSRVESRYDQVGRLAQQTLPYSVGNTQYWQTFGYDSFNRVTSIARPLSPTDTTAVTTGIAYSGLTTTVTDALNRNQIRVQSAVGMTARSQDHAGYHQNFAYNAFGDLTGVTDSASNTLQTIGYNIRGMKTSMTDMDVGSWTYKPNALGELEFIRDAKTTAPAWTTEMTYDVLGRMVTRKDVLENVISNFNFGNTSPDIGRLTSVTGGGHSETFEYYPTTGQLKKRTITADSLQYAIDYSYNALGLLEILTYPASTPEPGVPDYRFAVRHEYTNGFLTSVRDTRPPGTVFWSASASDAFGNVTSEQLGNGLSTTRTFDAVTGLINSIQTVKAPGTPAQNLTYQWDKVGNLKQRKDVQQNLTEEFYYDNLNRLDCSTLNIAPQTNCAALTAVQKNLDVDYNQLGNITSKTGLGTYQYDANKKHRLLSTSSGGHSYAYDANGNVNNRDGFGINWYSYNLPSLINGAGGSSSQFFYTAERERWKQVAMYGSTEEHTTYIGGLVEKRRLGGAGGVTSWRHYIAGGSGPVAVYTRKSAGANELHYLTHDHLGSVDSISNSTGTVETALSYGAFGERRNAAGWTGNPTTATWNEITDGTRRGFTSHEMLDNLNLTHMNGRVYDQITGRFLSADPFVPDPEFTQSFNRYSYVYNNPLTYTDPSGFMPSPDDMPGDGDWCNRICIDININFNFFPGQDYWDLRSRRTGTPPPYTAMRDGPRVVPVKDPGRDMVGSEVQKTLVQKVGAFLFPNVTALGERGVRGSAVDNVVGGLKAAYNMLLGLAVATNVSLTVQSALGQGPQPLEIADNQLGGAALVEGATAVFGAASVQRALAARGTHVVYQGIDKAGVVRYVGRTSRDVGTRGAEHIASGGGKENLIYRAVQGGENLTLQEARVLEQQLINQYGLGKNGGQLLNRINSIAKKYWDKYGIVQ
jgi:RHS repeat-associated protein